MESLNPQKYKLMFKLLTLGFLPLSFVVGNWPQYHGPLFDKSSVHIKGNITISTQKEPLWMTETPLGFSSFVTHNNLAFTLVGGEDEDGILRESCVALDIRTGKKIWQAQLGRASYGHGGGNAGTQNNAGGDGPRSTPSVNQEGVFIYDSEMNLYCLSGKSGKVIWQVDMIEQHGGKNITWKNASSPLLTHGVVLVCGGGAGQSLIAFDQKTGEIHWKTGKETLTHATPTLATLHGQTQVIFLCRSGLVSINPENGMQLWSQEFPFKVSTAASPVVAGDLVFCSAGYGVGAGVFKISKNGDQWVSEPLWRKRNELMNHWSTPLFYEGHLYGIFGFKEYGKAPLQCIDVKTGEIIWSKEGFGPGNLIRSGEKLIVLSDDGQLVIVSAKPQKYLELERRKLLTGKCWSTPIIGDNYLLARSTKEAALLPLLD
jgi:outer membrane protein assembly factor BamB